MSCMDRGIKTSSKPRRAAAGHFRLESRHKKRKFGRSTVDDVIIGEIGRVMGSGSTLHARGNQVAQAGRGGECVVDGLEREEPSAALQSGAHDLDVEELAGAEARGDASEKQPEGTKAGLALMELAAGVRLFRAADGRFHARVQAGGHHEVFGLRSSAFRDWLVDAYVSAHHKLPPQRAVNRVLEAIEARARFAVETAPVEARLGCDVSELGSNWRAFHEAQPRILGGLLDAVAAGLRTLPTVHVAALPRMADFARFGEAVGRGLGWTEGEFLAAYRENRREATASVIEASVLAGIIVKVAQSPFGFKEWTQSASEMLTELRPYAGSKARCALLPKTAAALGSELRRLAPQLREYAVAVKFNRTNGARTITLKKIVDADYRGVVPA